MRKLFFWILIISTFKVFSQKHFLKVDYYPHAPGVKIKVKEEVSSGFDRDKELQKVLLQLNAKQYLGASIDSVVENNGNYIAYIFTGIQFKWATLQKGNVDNHLLDEVGFKERFYFNKPFNYYEVARLQEKIIRWCEDHGYPFANIKLDSVVMDSSKISAQLSLTKNMFVKIDSVKIVGNAKIASIYLHKYTGLKPGDIYNESVMKRTDTRIRELPFVKQTKPFDILFTEEKAKVIFYLDKKNASAFDGVLGMLPDATTGKIIFTGDVRLRLLNTVGRGELFDLNWRSLPVNTQDLKARINYPYLFNTPFGVDLNLKIYKRDTTFIDVYTNTAAQYLFTGLTSFKVFVSDKKSSLLSTKGLEYITVLPPYADVRTVAYGIGFSTEKLDYRFNPRKGFVLTVSASAGNKNIKRNSGISELAYKNVKLRSEQYEGELVTSLFLPLFKRSTLRLGAQGAFIYGTTLFENEALRIGGFKTLRGVDEESIRATSYAIGTVEYRLLIEQNSYVYLFTDGAYYERNSPAGFINDTPIGFGTGISFETKAGIFSISYALAKQFNNPILLRSGKVHFGLVNYF